jgi:DNA-binding winged helix-turn-helix (wHTH) protein/TolB-like protein/Flp pilus assembly protein TadD
MSLDLKLNKHQINLSLVNSPDHLIYEFDNFRLHTEHLMLYLNGEEVSLTPKQVETLLALVERHGEIVSKENLMQRVWGDTAVEEANLIQNIHFLRRVLGESTNGKPMIETLRRRGYRFNGELKQNGDRSTAPAAVAAVPFLTPQLENKAVATDKASNGRFSGRRKLLAAFVIVLAAVSLLIAGLFYKRRSPSDPAARVRFAALPLKPIDPDNRNSLYENGIADAIINRLSSVKEFEVRSLNDVRDYNGIAQDPVAAGREQKVDYVLAPNYQLADGKIRITAPLINIATGKVEDTYSFEKEASSHFAVQDAVAADFGAKLIGRFGGTDPTHHAKRGTNNEEAYQLYLQAVYLCDRRRDTGVPKAIEDLERALQLDPNYAEAWAAKAMAHRYAAYSVADQSEQHERSIEAINKALAIDPNLPEAYSALCDNKLTYEYDLAGAEAACKHAVELGPNSSAAHQIYSQFLMSRGRRDESFLHIQIANDLAPTAFFVKRNYANTFYLDRQYTEAISRYKQLIDIEPTHLGTYLWLIRALEAQGNQAEAFEWLIRSLILQGVDNDTVQRFKEAYRTGGWRAVLLERIDLEKQTRRSDWRIAMDYAQVGDKDKAFEYLEKMYEQHNYFLCLLKVDPQLDPIRDDPRYADLVRRVEGH